KLCSNMIAAASEIGRSGSIVTGLGVIHCRTRASAARARAATARIRSRSVTIPTILAKSSTTTTAPTFAAFIFSAASPIVSDGSTVSTSLTIRSATVSTRPSLTQQTGKTAVFEHASPGLAGGAVVDRMLLEVDLGERRAAHVARLAEALVDAVRLRVRGAALAQLEPARELRVDRVGEPRHLVVRQV